MFLNSLEYQVFTQGQKYNVDSILSFVFIIWFLALVFVNFLFDQDKQLLFKGIDRTQVHPPPYDNLKTMELQGWCLPF